MVQRKTEKESRKVVLFNWYLLIDLWKQTNHQLTLLATTTHTATRQGNDRSASRELIWCAVESLMLIPICGYYEQPWIYMKQYDLVVLTQLYAPVDKENKKHPCCNFNKS